MPLSNDINTCQQGNLWFTKWVGKSDFKLDKYVVNNSFLAY